MAIFNAEGYASYRDDKQWFDGEYSTKKKKRLISLLHFLRVFSYAQFVVICKGEDFKRNNTFIVSL